MIAAPASKYGDIIDDLNHIDDDLDRQSCVFRLNHYKIDAKKRIQKDPEEAYTILGIISCIENDLSEMHRYHKIAINCSAQSILSLQQYCSSLLTQDLYKEVKEYALIGFEKSPEDRSFLIYLVEASFALGHDKDCQYYKECLEKLGFEINDPNDFREDNPETLLQIIQSVDKLLDENPQMIVKQDPNLEALARELVEGVDIS
jgi:hypothetical protein